MKKIIIIMLILCAAALGYYAVKTYLNNAKYNQPGIACGNGRLEATEVSISSKLDGRLEVVSFNEGDKVKKGDVMAVMQLNILNAELKQAEAELKKVQAELKQQESKFKFAEAEKKRYDGLLAKGATTREKTEKADSEYLAALAELEAGNAAVASAEAKVIRVKENINDSHLTSPVNGRVQYRVAEQGEILKSGGKVFNVIDLSDVYITFFLPETIAGKVKIGNEVRIVLDAIPDVPIPAKVTFVDSVAQFTPKTVETKEERQKLMFRVKAKIEPELLAKYEDRIMTGLPGEAWVKYDDNAQWPDFLVLKKDRK